jgi:hypothetical protein
MRLRVWRSRCFLQSVMMQSERSRLVHHAPTFRSPISSPIAVPFEVELPNSCSKAVKAKQDAIASEW